MKKIITVVILALGLAFGLSSCQKEFETSIDLAVDYSDEMGGLVLTKKTADICYIHVTSNTSWKACLTFPEQQAEWCSLEQTEGQGIAWIPLAYQANETEMERTAVFRIETSSKAIEFNITQP